MLEQVVVTSLVLVALATLAAVVRLMLGPTIPDRLVALDAVAANIIALVVLFAIWTGSPHYFDAVLVIAVLTFVGTAATARFIEKGAVFDGDSD